MRESPRITIVDYGVGNLRSLIKAFGYFGIEILTLEDSESLFKSDAIVLPGVGAFEAGMRGLKVRGLIDAVKGFANSGKPVLGICLGAQLLLSRGYEFGIFEGLDLIPGKVVKFPGLKNNEKIPHVGWNKIYAGKGVGWEGTILSSLPQDPFFYFVHSYILIPEDPQHTLALANYGGCEFCSVIKKGNIYGCQFHPEKSGKMGLDIISDFINLVKSWLKN